MSVPLKLRAVGYDRASSLLRTALPSSVARAVQHLALACDRSSPGGCSPRAPSRRRRCCRCRCRADRSRARAPCRPRSCRSRAGSCRGRRARCSPGTSPTRPRPSRRRGSGSPSRGCSALPCRGARSAGSPGTFHGFVILPSPLVSTTCGHQPCAACSSPVRSYSRVLTQPTIGPSSSLKYTVWLASLSNCR